MSQPIFNLYFGLLSLSITSVHTSQLKQFIDSEEKKCTVPANDVICAHLRCTQINVKKR